MASTKVLNWARKPGCRIAAKDRLVDGDASTAAAFVSVIENHQFAAQQKGHIPQRDALDMFWDMSGRKQPDVTGYPAAL
jgi:hypothetical protein